MAKYEPIPEGALYVFKDYDGRCYTSPNEFGKYSRIGYISEADVHPLVEAKPRYYLTVDSYGTHIHDRVTRTRAASFPWRHAKSDLINILLAELNANA